MFVFAVVALRSSTGVTSRPAVRLRSRYRHGHGRLRRLGVVRRLVGAVFAVLFAFWGLSYATGTRYLSDRGAVARCTSSQPSRPRRCGVRGSQSGSVCPQGRLDRAGLPRPRLQWRPPWSPPTIRPPSDRREVSMTRVIMWRPRRLLALRLHS